MLESLIPSEYLPYFDFLPDVQKVANVGISLTPLYTYGTACWGIYRKQLSVGFSIDICATMLMASVLRILYYFISPYEVSLLRQSFVMVAVQCVLLKVALKYRPVNYDPELLHELPSLSEKIALIPKLSLSLYQFDNCKFYHFLGSVVYQYVSIFTGHVVRLFDVYYKRPFCFWQWVDESLYWNYLVMFSLLFSVVTLVFLGVAAYGSFIGTLGLLIELLLPLPQILILQRLQTVANFRVVLLFAWLGGDCLKLSYLFFGTDNVLGIFIFAGLFQMCLDFVILFQYLHYLKLDRQNALAQLPLYELEAQPRLKRNSASTISLPAGL